MAAALQPPLHSHFLLRLAPGTSRRHAPPHRWSVVSGARSCEETSMLISWVRVGVKRVRRNDEEGEVVLIAPGDEDGVVSDREGVDMDDAVVVEQSRRQRVPGSGVQADARDRPEVLGQCGDQGGKLGCVIAGVRPPRPVENTPPVMREAESAYDEATAQLVNALAERRRLLRAGWQDQNPDAQSEELRAH